MKSLDPRLRRLVRKSQTSDFDIMAETAVEALPIGRRDLGDDIPVEVLVRLGERGTVDALKDLGMDVWGLVDGPFPVVTGEAPLTALEAIGELGSVERLEASRPLGDEMDLARSDTRVNALHTASDPGSVTVRGAGVVVGVIDTGIDYRHPKFRHSDGTSRILFLWDQAFGGQHPNVPFGREYTKADLDAALATDEPLSEVPHRDRNGHGTHVAGIAAGNGRAGLKFRGVAPDADLIIVASRSDGETLGRSASSLAAYQYIIERAAGQPVVINQSQGMNGGGHSGETVLETGIDNLLRQPGVVAVKSAGNEQTWRIHAGGELTAGDTENRRFEIRQNNFVTTSMELWYDDRDTIRLAVEPPGEPPLPFVGPDDGDQFFESQAGNEISILFDRNADDTGDTQATLEILPHRARVLRPGTWKLHLRADHIEEGRFDIWIERNSRRNGGQFQARFRSSSNDPTRTISVPGTARRILTVGAYVTRGTLLETGRISNFSSRGPTRYGFTKPEITAPGQSIISALSSDSRHPQDPDSRHTPLPGTSMAAPHVAGGAALLLSLRPRLTSEQVKQILERTARTDMFSDSAPDNTWGHGKLRMDTAVELTRTVVFPEFLEIRIEGTELSWVTDLPATATVRFHTSRRRLLLGRNLGTRALLNPATSHSVDLSELDAGEWFCEILAFSEDGFRTTEDNDGAGHVVHVE